VGVGGFACCVAVVVHRRRSELWRDRELDLGGTGKTMVPVPEMEAFASRLNFMFVAHEKGDANRSAGVERPFHHIENNFLAGRKFADFADANRQARAWCDQINAKFRRSLQASSNDLYRAGWPALRRLPVWLLEVYLLHQRIVDLEGYIHVDGHIYSVPYQLVGKPVEVRDTKDKLLVFVGPREVAVHDKVVSTPQAAQDARGTSSAARTGRPARLAVAGKNASSPPLVRRLPTTPRRSIGDPVFDPDRSQADDLT
jgi:hypothetical protein